MKKITVTLEISCQTLKEVDPEAFNELTEDGSDLNPNEYTFFSLDGVVVEGKDVTKDYDNLPIQDEDEIQDFIDRLVCLNPGALQS